jgi:hypothetical protein
MAGITGLCPHCKAPVYVPIPQKSGLSEDVIMDILGPTQTPPSDINSSGINLDEAPSHRHEKGHHETPWKSCVKCNREIPSQTHICPYCHTYIAGLSDIIH